MKALRETIESILGLDQGHKLIIIGAGRLGTALAAFHRGFSNAGFSVAAMFDANPAQCGTGVDERAGAPGERNRAVAQRKCRCRLPSSPCPKAGRFQAAVDSLARAGGAHGILNFAEVDLDRPRRRADSQRTPVPTASWRSPSVCTEQEILTGKKTDSNARDGGDARGNPSFRKRKGSPRRPLPKETTFAAFHRPEGAADAAVSFHLQPGGTVPARPLRGGARGKPSGFLLWEGAREPFLSPRKKGLLSRRASRCCVSADRPGAPSARRDARKPRSGFLWERAQREPFLSPERKGSLGKEKTSPHSLNFSAS